MALVDVSVVEQRYQAVLMVQSGVRVVAVAARFGVLMLHASCPEFCRRPS